MAGLLNLLRSRWARRIGIGVGVVLVLWIGAAFLVPLFVSDERIRTELVARIEQATGRKARIDGTIGFSTFPGLRVSAGGIGLSDPSGEQDALSVETVSVGVRLLALLGGRVEITGILLDQPRIVIEQAPATAPADPIQAQIDSANAGEAVTESVAAAAAALDNLRLGTVRIRDGELVWRRLDGQSETVGDINLTMNVPTLAEGGAIDGDFAWRGLDHHLELNIGAAGEPERLRQVPIGISLTSDPLALSASGVLFTDDALFVGALGAKGDSLKAVADAFDTALPDVPAYGTFNVTAQIKANPTDLSVDVFDIAMTGLVARGGAVIDLNRSRPGIGMRLAAETVDVNAFTGGTSAAGAGSAAPSGSGGGATGGDARLDFSFLKLADANVKLTANRLTVGSMAADNIAADLTVVDGVLKSSLQSIAFGGAPGSGELTLDASRAVPAMTGQVKASDIDIAALAALAAPDRAVFGTGRVDLSFNTRGATSAELIANLDAQGEIAVSNGRYQGLGLAGTFNDPAADVVDDINIAARFTALDRPVEANGSLSWRGEQFKLSAVASPKAIIAGTQSNASIQVESRRATFGYSGRLTGMTGGSGEVSMSTRSLRELLGWFGRPLGPGGGLQAFSVRGTVAVEGQEVTFNAREIALDGSTGRGGGTLNLAGKRPSVSAELALATLDFTPYLGNGAGAGGGAAAGGAPASGGGWSTEPIGFEGLGAVDAVLSLSADSIVLDNIRTGRGALKATIKGGQLDAQLTELALYQGSGSGRLNIGGATAAPNVTATFDLDDLAALPFLTDAFGFRFIEGTGGLKLAVKTQGASQAALVAGLDGDFSFEFRDGAIRGINVSKMMQALPTNILTGWQNSGGDRTDFTRLAASFQIARGIATTSDLSMVGPLVRVSGGGTVDMPRQQLKLRVDPKIVASLQGQGGNQDVTGFSVPVVIDGPWARPRIYPEIEGILQNPQQALQQLQTVGEGLVGLANGSGDSGGGLLGRLLGGGQGSAPAANQQQQPAPSGNGGVGGLLGNLFGSRQQSAPAAPPPAVATPPAPPPPAPEAAAEPQAGQPGGETPPAPDAAPPPAAASGDGQTPGFTPRSVPAVRIQVDPNGEIREVPGAPPAAEAEIAANTPPENRPQPRSVPFIRFRTGPNGEMVPVEEPAAGVPVASAPATEAPAAVAEEGPLPPLPRPKPERQVADTAPAPEPAPAPATPQDGSPAVSTDDVLRNIFGR